MKRFAFFDVDDTLITVKSMFDFFRYWTLEWRRESAALEAFEREFSQLRAAGESRENLNRAYYRYFAGIRSEDSKELVPPGPQPGLPIQSAFSSRRPCIFFGN